MEFERRAPKIIFQAWENLLPAQSVKNEVANGDEEKQKPKPKRKQKKLTETLTIKKLRRLNYDNESESNWEEAEVYERP